MAKLLETKTIKQS